MKKIITWIKEMLGIFPGAAKECRALCADGVVAAKGLKGKKLVENALLALLICGCFALYSTLREGTADLFMAIFIPLLFANFLLMTFGSLVKAPSGFMVLVSLLTTTGVFLQIFLLPAGDEDSMKAAIKFILFIAVGIFLGLFALPFAKLMSSDSVQKKTLRRLLVILILGLYLCMVLFGSTINGARAWLFGGHFQVTEVEKFLAVIYFALLECDPSLTEKKKSLRSFLMLCAHAGFCVLANELGTLIIILVTAGAMRCLFASPESKKRVFFEIIGLVGVGVVVFGICALLYSTDPNRTDVEETSEETPIVYDTAQILGTKEIPVEETSTPETSGTTADGENADGTNGTDNAASESVVSGALDRLRSIYPKVATRVEVLIHPDKAEEADKYQSDAAKRAILISGLVGTSKKSLAFLPEVDCDFIFIYTLVRLGWIGIVILFFAWLVLFGQATVGAARTAFREEGIIGFSFMLTMVIEGVFCAAANLSILPVVGLPFPLLSNGGSSLSLSIAALMFVAYMLRESAVMALADEKENEKEVESE